METLIAIKQAFGLLLSGDSALFAIIFLSLKVNLTAVGYAALLGFPMGALLATTRFYGHTMLVGLVNALMGLPPVVVGLAVYMMIRARDLWSAGFALYADGDDYRASDSGDAHYYRPHPGGIGAY